MLRETLVGLVAVALAGCGTTKQSGKPSLPPTAEGRPPTVDLAAIRQSPRELAFAWQPWSAKTFERAARAGRFVLLSCTAPWCHECRALEEATLTDPDVGRLVAARFVAVRVDIAERPDLEQRFGERGWPALVVLSPQGLEVSRIGGYRPPGELSGLLRKALRAAPSEPDVEREPRARETPVGAMAWVAHRAAADLDDYFDAEAGSWGERQKTPIGPNLVFELRRHARGEPSALERATLTLTRQRQLIDPVWGGLYVSSAGPRWDSPSHAKLALPNAQNLEAYAEAYAATKRAAYLRDADQIVAWVDRFLTSPEGTFFASHEGSVNGNDPTKPFVAGKTFFSKDDAGRRALGEPFVDRRVYALENGAMIAALAALHRASGRRAHLERARRAADAAVATLVAADGSVRHRREMASPRFLADAAYLGRGLVSLAETSGEKRYRDVAERIAANMTRVFADDETSAFFGRTPESLAGGSLARRRRPFTHNVEAARFLAALAKASGDSSHRERARRVLRAIATPPALDYQGRFVGEFLVALDDVELYPWRGAASSEPPAVDAGPDSGDGGR